MINLTQKEIDIVSGGGKLLKPPGLPNCCDRKDLISKAFCFVGNVVSTFKSVLNDVEGTSVIKSMVAALDSIRGIEALKMYESTGVHLRGASFENRTFGGSAF